MNYSNGSVGTTIGMDSGPEITRHLLKVTTDALLAHLKALQEVTNKLKEMNIDNEIQQIMLNFDKSRAEEFLREGK